MSMPAARKLSVVDLFAGCGGLSLGLELVGFEPILAAELSPSARASYRENRKHLNDSQVVHDVRALARIERSSLRRQAGLKAGEHPTLVSGGPPCQGFSGIGHRRTQRDVEKHEIVSNHLYRDLVAVIDTLQPDVFLFENVRGLLSARWKRDEPQKVWDTVRRHFARKLGDNYAIAFELVHGYQYGVPQNRPRVLMLGLHRRNWSTAGVSETQSISLKQAVVSGVPRGFESGLIPKPYEWAGFVPHPEELLGDLNVPDWWSRRDPKGRLICRAYPAGPTSQWQTVMRLSQAGTELPLEEHEFSKHSPEVQRRFSAAQKTADGLAPAGLRTKKFAQRALPPKWLRPPHITVASLPDDFIHYKSARSLTVREWARLQGFPDWYRFLGPRTTGGHRRAGDVRKGDSVRETPKYTQIGNAVPVQLAAALGWHIRKLLRVGDEDSHGPFWDTPLAVHLRANLDRRE